MHWNIVGPEAVGARITDFIPSQTLPKRLRPIERDVGEQAVGRWYVQRGQSRMACDGGVLTTE
jgi:hypothetical protein